MACEDDGSLLLLFKTGDFSAYQKIFHRHYALLCAYALNIIKDKPTAEDVVQQLFVDILQPKIYKNLNGNIKGYLYTAVHNRCLRVLDNKRRNGNHLTHLKQNNEQIVYPNLDLTEPNPSPAVLAHLKEIAANLPSQRRQAVQLFYFQGKRQLEVAQSMGISLNSVKTHLKLALATFRKKMTQQ